MAQEIASFANENRPMLDLTVHTDASVGVAARGIDIVLIGADLIDKSAAVSNKISLLSTILTARYIAPQGKFVALSKKEKALPFSPPGHEETGHQEVTQVWGKHSASLKSPRRQVNVKNVYFEWVPADLIDHYINKYGVADSVGIARYARKLQR
ncbi:hypothetical protein HYE68_009459 [Fusarium pseudograminearum]|nr:hypothetical protein HYE68_009459 [Fusarium pseudograminearum]